jgi:hypothetical protein
MSGAHGVGVRAVWLLGLLGSMGCRDAKPPIRIFDAGPDSPDSDVPPPVTFDIAYINEYTIRWNSAGAGLLGFLAIANTGTAPLDLNRVTVVRTTDNDPEIISQVAVERPSVTLLAPGQAAGDLGPGVRELFDTASVLPEPNTDDTLLFSMRFPNQDIGFVGRPLQVEATIRIEDTEIVLPFTVHFVPADGTSSVESVARVRSR